MTSATIHVDIDENLLAAAKQAAGVDDADELLAMALRLLVKNRQSARVLGLKGRIQWEGDLGEMRRGRIEP